MKKYFFLLVFVALFFGCSPDKVSNKNPYLPNYTFTIDININLPAYSDLKIR